jgi:hypothetical protein
VSFEVCDQRTVLSPAAVHHSSRAVDAPVHER